MTRLQCLLASLALLFVGPTYADTQLFSNNAQTTLSASLSSGSTTATVSDGSGFQTPGAGEYELLVITDGANYEIAKLTSRSGNTLTITRSQEGTTAPASFAVGTIVKGSLTAGTLGNFAQLAADQTIDFGGTVGFDGAVDYTSSVDLSAATAQIPGSSTLPGSCSGSEIYLDTDATSGQRIYACESGVFVLQGDGSGGGSSLIYSDQTITSSNFTATAGYSYRLTISGMTADRSLVLPSGCAEGEMIAWTLLTDAPAIYELILKGASGVTVSIPGKEATAAEVTRYYTKSESGLVICDGSGKWIMPKYRDGRIASSGTMRISSDITTNSAGLGGQIDLDTVIEQVGGWAETSSDNGFVARREAKVLISGQITSYAGIGSAKYYWARLYVNLGELSRSTAYGSGGSGGESVQIPARYAKVLRGYEIQLYFIAEEADRGVSSNAKDTWLSFTEILD